MSEPIPPTPNERGGNEPGENAETAIEDGPRPAESTPDSGGAGSDAPIGAGGETPESPPPEDAPAEDDAPSDEDPRVAAVEALAADVAALNDQLLRAVAETENVRRRAERERADAARYAMTGFARDILGVADNLRRTLDSAGGAEGEERLAALLEGVGMTERELRAAFGRHGIREVSPLGEKFDHNYHQALFEVPDPEREPGAVAQVVQVGYVIGERLLRPAMVAVAKAPEAPAEEPPPEAVETETEAAPAPPSSPGSDAGFDGGAGT